MPTTTFFRTPYNGAQVSNGTAATGGDGTNPGGNTGSLSINALSGGTAQWVDDNRGGGTRGVKFTNAAGQASFGRQPLPSSTYTPGAEFEYEVPAAPDSASSPITLNSFRNGSGSIQLRFTSALLLDLLAGVSGSQVSAPAPKKPDGTTTMAPLTAGSVVRIGMYATGITKDANGNNVPQSSSGKTTIYAAVWTQNADKATYLGMTSMVATVGTAPFTASDLGILPYPTVRTTTVFNARFSDDATDFMGPFVATNQPPKVTLPAPQTAGVNAAVSITATAADPDGTVASYAWTLIGPGDTSTALTGASTATVSLTTGQAGSLYVLQCTVTDNNGAQSSATTEVRVPTSADGLPLPNNVAVGWTRVGGTTDGGVLRDSDPNTFLESNAALSATAQRLRVRADPMVNRNGSVVFGVGMIKAGTGTCTAALSLQQGTTVISSRTGITVTDTEVFQTLNLSNAEIASITDWSNLWLVADFTS